MKALCVLMISPLASQPLQPTETKKAPETDEAKVVRLTSHLESNPLSDHDKSIRSWLLDLAVETQDIAVVVCDILGTASGEEFPHSAIYTGQMIFGNASYQISHPDKRGDLLTTQLAASRSALKAYSSILSTQPKARIPHFDELISKDRLGNLETYLTPIITERCND